jgi:hypothetical protein
MPIDELPEDIGDHEDINPELRDYERSITRYPNGTVTNWNIAYNGERLP